jgi:hypothetical protein
MRIILSYQAFLFVWLKFQLDKSEIGGRKREVIPTQRHSSFLRQPDWRCIKFAWGLVCFLPDICACVYHIQKLGLTYSVDRSRLPNSHCLNVGGYCTAARLAHRRCTNASRPLLIRLRQYCISNLPDKM